jgi:hypothetical protein
MFVKPPRELDRTVNIDGRCGDPAGSDGYEVADLPLLSSRD